MGKNQWTASSWLQKKKKNIFKGQITRAGLRMTPLDLIVETSAEGLKMKGNICESPLGDVFHVGWGRRLMLKHRLASGEEAGDGCGFTWHWAGPGAAGASRCARPATGGRCSASPSPELPLRPEGHLGPVGRPGWTPASLPAGKQVAVCCRAGKLWSAGRSRRLMDEFWFTADFMRE